MGELNQSQTVFEERRCIYFLLICSKPYTSQLKQGNFLIQMQVLTYCEKNDWSKVVTQVPGIVVSFIIRLEGVVSQSPLYNNQTALFITRTSSQISVDFVTTDQSEALWTSTCAAMGRVHATSDRSKYGLHLYPSTKPYSGLTTGMWFADQQQQPEQHKNTDQYSLQKITPICLKWASTIRPTFCLKMLGDLHGIRSIP